MMCQEIEALLEAFLNQELDARQRAAVENHLLSCSECSTKLADLSLSREWLAEMMEVELPQGLHERIMTSVRAAQEQDESADNVVELPPKRKLSYPERAVLYEQSSRTQKPKAPAWARWAATVAAAAVLLVGAQRVFDTGMVRPPNETASGSAEGALLSQADQGLLRGIYEAIGSEDGEATLRLESSDLVGTAAKIGEEDTPQDEAKTARAEEEPDAVLAADDADMKTDAMREEEDAAQRDGDENTDADDAATPESLGVEELTRRLEPRASLSLMIVPGSIEAPAELHLPAGSDIASGSGGGNDGAAAYTEQLLMEADEAEMMDEAIGDEHEEAEPMMLMNAALPQRIEADAADSEALAAKYYGMRVSDIKGSLDGWLLTLKSGAIDLPQIVQRASEFNCSAVLNEDNRSASLYGTNRSLYQLLQLFRLTDEPQWAAPNESRNWRSSVAQEAERWNHLLIVLAD